MLQIIYWTSRTVGGERQNLDLPAHSPALSYHGSSERR